MNRIIEVPGQAGGETQLMYNVFSSDDETMNFYLTFYCLMNPSVLFQCFRTGLEPASRVDKNHKSRTEMFAGVEQVRGVGTISWGRYIFIYIPSSKSVI